MSIGTLTNLRDYLCGTLTPANMLWLSAQLSEYAKRDEKTLKPYTMDELNAMLDEAERQFSAGEYLTNEEVFSKYEKELEEEQLPVEVA